MHKQRYVSDLLTHFVGRGHGSEDDQYRLLSEILNLGWVLSRVMVGTPVGDIPARVKQPSYTFSADIEFDDLNTVFVADVVCLADIPLADIAVHMGKYSRFGVAFSKEFLLQFGANPVYYVSINSIERSEGGANYEEIFRKHIQTYIDHHKPGKYVPDSSGAYSAEDSREIGLDMFLLRHVMCHLKFWSASAADLDDDNFYLEREWRVYGGFPFSLHDVQRVILPGAYSTRFRSDFPSYPNELVFADGSL